MRLTELTHACAMKAKEWRNERLDALRTPYPLSTMEQHEWYNRREGRWWSIVEEKEHIGYAGIQHIQWESGIGELSLLMAPEYEQARGAALDLVLVEAFGNMGLKTVYAEVYDCNRDSGWWVENAFRRGVAYAPKLRNRKYYQGKYYDSTYYSFDRDAYAAIGNLDW